MSLIENLNLEMEKLEYSNLEILQIVISVYYSYVIMIDVGFKQQEVRKFRLQTLF